MHDVFISYARKDRKYALALAEAFEQRGWSVWWDHHLLPGFLYRKVIEEELTSARSVVVLWSQHSVRSDWVISEAEMARSRGVLVPALIEHVKPPLGFGEIQAAQLEGWAPAAPHEEFEKLVASIAHLLSSPATVAPETGHKARDVWARAAPSTRSLAVAFLVFFLLVGVVWLIGWLAS